MATALLLVFFFLSASATPTPSEPDFLTANVDALYRGGGSSPAFTAQALEAIGGAALLHRDSLISPYRPANATIHELLAARLQRDARRVSAVAERIAMAVAGVSRTQLLKPSSTSSSSSMTQEDIQAGLRSGLPDGSGEYFVSLGVGTPPRTVNLVADTGSDVLWIQCLPCQSCYGQSDPLFNPSISSTFTPVSCGSPLCSQLLIRGCSRSTNKCLYQVSYGDGSFTVGDFSQETLFFGNEPLSNVAIGCGHNNQGLFTGAAGLLGLGRGRLSLPSQLSAAGGSSAAAFSYCLPSRDSTAAAPLVFGPGSITSSLTQSAPLDSNPKLDTFYYVRMVGISVGGNALPISSSNFALDSSSGGGGVILDSGTAVTRLVTAAYTSLRDAFRSGMQSDVQMTGGFSLFDTCYDLSGRSSVMLPAVSLLFDGGGAMRLPAENIMVPVDNSGTYCLAFAPNSDDFSIIGNIQQQSFRFGFEQNRVRFAPGQC